MKNILRKLHIVPSQPEDGDGSSSVSLSRSNGRSLTSWFNSAISRNSSPQIAGSPKSSSPTVVADGRESSGSSKARGVEMDEEYQIQIALEMSLREDPEAAQIEAVKQISLSDPSLENTAAEVVAFRYWNYNALGYDDKISDGFYDLYGILSESAMAKMPSLVDLQGTPVSDDISWEAVLVNRAEDSDLVELEQKALDMALELKSEFPDFGANGLIQRLANLVANYMGGATRDHFSMLKSWRNLSNSLRSRIGNMILPLGSLTIGLARHRALLFKLLADSLGIPCRLVKGKHYTGSDGGALNIVKLRDGREYIVDLMADPGTLIPSNLVALSKNYEETSYVNTGVSSSIGFYPQAEPLEQRCLSGNLDTSNSSDVTSDEMMNQKSQRLSSSPRESSENILDSFCKFTNIGSTKSQESSNVTDHPYQIGSSPSWTEGTSSPAVMMKVKDISQYMINATKGNPKLAQKLHDVLLESGVVAPPNLFTEIPTEIPTELPQAASVVSMNVSKDKDETIKGEDGFKNKNNPDVTCGPFLPHLHLHKNVAPLRSQLDPLKPVDGMKVSYPLDSREEESLNPLQFAKHMPVAAAAAATAAVVASSMVVAAAKSNADKNLDVPVTAAATATAVALVATTAVVESCLPVPIISQLGRDHGHDASLVMELDANEVHQEGSSDKSTSNESGKSDVSLEDVAELEIPWDDIILGERIGLGSFGEVYRGDWHGTEVAVKKFLHQDISSDALEEFLSEVRIMRRLRHPNVVLLMGAVTRVPHLSIVTEFLHRGSLFRLIHRPNNQLDERRRLRMALDVARGMNYLHNCTPVIVHRDLKSPNLLVDKNWVVKVCDFGLSRIKLNTFLSSRSTAGTAEWMAPEVLRNEPSDEKADVFSFGVILWELCTLQQPWGGMNPMQVVGAVGFQHRRLDIPHDIDLVIADIINRCWNTDPKKRPSFSEIMATLKLLQRPVSSTQTTRERGS